MKYDNCIEKGLIVAIVFLFVVPALFPMVIGYVIETNDIELAEVSLDETVTEKLTAPTNGLMDSAWPMHCRDARHTGQSPHAPVGKYSIEKWRFEMIGMATTTSPAIDSNGTIYVAGGDYYFFAVYTNGTEKWHFETNGFYFATPALASDGTIYIGSTDEKLYAINPNGTLKWKLKIGDGWVCGSPAIDDNGIIYATSVNGCNICAIYPNGTKKWSYHTNGWVYSSPAVANDGTIYCGSNDGNMYALYPNGTLKWKYGTGGFIQSAPSIGEDGTIYFGSWNGYLYALYPNGTLRWRYLTRLIDDSSPAIAEDGTIYVGTVLPETGGLVYSLNPDGVENWVFETGDEIYSSPAIDSNGIVYIGSRDGNLYAINPKGKLQWKYDTFREIMSSPAIAEDGTIYFVAFTPLADSALYAVEVREHAANLELGEIQPRIGSIKIDITNTGDVTANEVRWKIVVEGDLLIDYLMGGGFTRIHNGTIGTFEPEESITIRALPFFGLGLIHIKISVSAPEANPDGIKQYAYIIGPFIFLRD